ncbi:MAG: hypothetical protein DI533_00465 [Cereibacter sphaeroides]|uniref:Uncharacterized protein n=1 Tax=Cereibacter sphaeroides TaxID=1063 RepID=A0A2W5SIS8_CERSP|nr:MAG: hypothetical protein DI533_00465 [Cereibacter sphaeroides]
MTQMIENSDRGITLNKGLAWTLATGLLVGGLWVGNTVTGLQSAAGQLTSALTDIKAEVRDGRAVDAAMDGRVRTLENTATRSGAQYEALSRSLDEVKATLRDQTDLLRRISVEDTR